MATKNIVKSVLEGGRGSYSKYEKHQSHDEERASIKGYLKRVSQDPESADDDDYDDIRPVHKGFVSKFHPMYRWLEKQVGRKWDDVHSEVFHIRTTVSRHAIFDYLLSMVNETGSGFDEHGVMIDPNIEVASGGGKKLWAGEHKFYYVDSEGILQKR